MQNTCETGTFNSAQEGEEAPKLMSKDTGITRKCPQEHDGMLCMARS